MKMPHIRPRCAVYTILPAVLYVRGTLPDFEKEPSLSIVGQRRATPRGLETAQRFAHVLSAHGFVIVSGLALGIDSAGHRGALEGPAPTVAVFGTAIDVCYPAAHNGLLRQILEEGAAVSEYPPGTHSLPHFFLHRNRIISGLTLGTLVVEAPRHSGSLNTAASAMNQGRDVFAVPGCIDLPEYEGSNALLRDGAILCTSPVEICREYAGPVPRHGGHVGRREPPVPRARAAGRTQGAAERGSDRGGTHGSESHTGAHPHRRHLPAGAAAGLPGAHGPDHAADQAGGQRAGRKIL